MKNEAEVFRKMQSGDYDSFGLVFEEHADRLYSYALGFVKDGQTAENIVQDVFIYLWANRDKIRWQDSIGNYLLRSVKNACLNHKMRQKIERRYQDYVVSHPEESKNDNESLEELHAQAVEFIERLPEKCREIFILGILDGMNYAAIAERLGISVNTVKTQMQRAKGKLRTLSSGDKLMMLLL